MDGCTGGFRYTDQTYWPHLCGFLDARMCTCVSLCMYVQAGLYCAFSPTTNYCKWKASLDWMSARGTTKDRNYYLNWMKLWLRYYTMTTQSNVVYFPVRLHNINVIFRMKGSPRYFWKWCIEIRSYKITISFCLNPSVIFF